MKRSGERLPLYLTCRTCGKVREVGKPSDQQRRKASRCLACAGRRNLAQTDHHATGRLGGLKSGERMRAILLQRIKGMTPLEAYRAGRRHGWHAATRKVLRRPPSQVA